MAKVIRVEHRRYSYRIRAATRTTTDADGVGGAGIRGVDVDSAAGHGFGSWLGAGQGNAAFLKERSHSTTVAYQRLLADPGRAAEVGSGFRGHVYDVYLKTRSTGKHRSAADLEELAGKARYEVARGWNAVLAGFAFDMVLRRGLEQARARAACGERVVPPPTGTITRQRPFDELSDAIFQVLPEHIEDFWKQCGSGGRYEAFFAEYRRATVFDDDVQRRWYADFERAMQISGRRKGEYMDMNAFIDAARASKETLVTGLQGQSENAAEIAAIFHYADLSLPSPAKHELFRLSIPALAERAMAPKAANQRVIGSFAIELRKLDSDPAILTAEARKILGLQPGESVRVLEPKAPAHSGHCPAHAMSESGGSSTDIEVLELTAMVASETIWQPAR
ncbi:hypothetical protein [Nocardia brasiliensis]|uniref:hypothetical protein n=1 Tax=Nocardia brasiliensis TaxID=37326 RepID=UPI0024569BE3|nr:hypothetical protein [Nocardia brasiliensis]